MTIGTLKMPRMGETMEEGKLAAWLVEPGQAFKRGQDILEVETDKTIVEFPALGDGTVIETLVEIGQMVSVGTPIARIDMGNGPNWTDDGTAAEVDEAPATEASQVVSAAGSALAQPTRVNDQTRATPAARRLARHRGIDLSALQGSGRRGRIERGDVDAVAAAPAQTRLVAGVTCLEKGPATGAPVVFLHGFGGDHAVWGGLQSRLVLVGRRTLSVDLPGHGTTAHEAQDTSGLHVPIDTAMTALGFGASHLVAHSMGALAAVALARTRQVKSLTLIAPAGLGHSIDGGFLKGVAQARTAGELSFLLDRITDGPHGLSSAMMAEIYASVSRRRLTDLADALVGSTGQAVSIRAELAQLAEQMPVRLILGHRDRIIDWREAVDVSPRIAVHHLPRVGHSPHWESLSDVAAIITDATR
jgi:pyruvate dehydrogenase E2 component (dihydrolipoamide acetyltransferase)